MAKLEKIVLSFTQEERISNRNIILDHTNEIFDALKDLIILKGVSERTLSVSDDCDISGRGETKVFIGFEYPEPPKNYKYTLMFEELEIKIDAYPHEEFIIEIENNFERKGNHEGHVESRSSPIFYIPYSVRKLADA